WYLSRDHRLGSIGLASAIIDRTTGLAALASVALLALLVFETPIPAREWIMGACIAVLVGFTLMILVAPTVSSWLSTIVPITDERPLGKWRAISRETALAISNMHGRSGVMLNALLVGVAVQLL